MVKKHDVAIVESEENLLIDFQFLLQEALTEKQISLSELAQRAGLSKARISQLMGPEANPTIKNMARLFHAIGETICISKMKAKAASEPRQEWKWTIESDASTRSDELLVAAIKATAASNDNYGERFTFIDSELEMAA